MLSDSLSSLEEKVGMSSALHVLGRMKVNIRIHAINPTPSISCLQAAVENVATGTSFILSTILRTTAWWV